MDTNISCQTLPSLLSSFVDSFVDFSVSGGIFLPPSPTPPSPPPPQTTFPRPPRLIALGDLHGDLLKSKQALRLAGLIDSADNWSGGAATLVQVGDIFDRGGDEIKLLYFFEKLKRQASKMGGTVITLNGNHEIMNVEGDFRFATPAGLAEFRDWAMWYEVGNNMKRMCVGLGVGVILELFEERLEIPKVRSEEIRSAIRARYSAVRPGGPIARRFLVENRTVAIVGDSVFVHGGLLPGHVEYGLERANEEVSEWICGARGKVERELVRTGDSLVWSRKFSNERARDCDCDTLEHVLKTIPGVKRMIMGHTIQDKGINGVCGNRAIRIDVGMSRGCGNGLPEVLEIKENSEVRILTSNSLFRGGYNANVGGDKKDGLGLFKPEAGPKQVQVKA